MNQNFQLRTVFVLVRHGSRTPCHPQFCFDVDFKNELIQHPAHTFTPIQVIRQSEEGSSSKKNFSEAIVADVYLKGGQCKPGQLVGKGAKDQYAVGQKLRRRYVEEKKFLSAENEVDDLFVQSSFFQRTIESARCIIAGMED